MVNQFKTLLANVSYEKPSDHIQRGFNELTLPFRLATFYDQLFLGANDRYKKLFLAQRMTSLVHSTTFRPYITKEDKRITYNTDDNGVYFSAISVNGAADFTQRWDAIALHNRIKSDNTLLQAMLNQPGYEGVVYKPDANPVYDLASILVCYVDKVRFLIQ